MKIMKSKIILFSAVILMTGCEPAPQVVPNTVLQPKVNAQVQTETTIVSVPPKINNRVLIERLSIVRDSVAYGEQRAAYLIIDTKTGIEYIGVSGIGIAEAGVHSEGKYSRLDER